MTNPIHSIPVNDLREHVVSKDCWCHPTKDPEANHYVHHAMDLREEYENGRKPS